MKIRPLIALLVLVAGCGSDDDPVGPEFTPSFVAGYVRHNDTAKSPLANVKVHLIEYHYSEGWIGGGIPYPTGWSKMVCTGPNGYFSFKFDAQWNAGYQAEVYTTSITSEEIEVPPGNHKYLTLWVPSNLNVYLCD